MIFLLFIDREPTTWTANNCLQIMVSSCAMSFNFVWLQTIFFSLVNETTLFPFLRSLLRENDRSLRFLKIFLKFPKIILEKQTNKPSRRIPGPLRSTKISRPVFCCFYPWHLKTSKRSRRTTLRTESPSIFLDKSGRGRNLCRYPRQFILSMLEIQIFLWRQSNRYRSIHCV